VRPALFVGRLEKLQNVFRARLELRDQGYLDAPRDGAHQGQVARVAPHDLHYVRAVVGDGEMAVPLILSMAFTAVSMAVSTPMASSVPGMSLSMVAGTPTASTPASPIAFALVRLPHRR
jgi:hypothetical protein